MRISCLFVLAVLAVPQMLLSAAEEDVVRTTSVAESVAETAGASVPSFRRVYVPADFPNLWPTKGKRFLPIDRIEFGRLLDLVNAGQHAAPGILAARVTHAEYWARIEGEDVLTGRALLTVEHYSNEPVLMPLSPWGVATIRAFWSAEDTAGKQNLGEGKPALLGNGTKGTTAVLVNGSGRLVIEWTMRGQRNLSGTVGFPLKLPQTTSGLLILDAPDGVLPEVDRAIVSELPMPSDGVRRWKIQTGGRVDGLLRLTTRETRGQRRELTLFRQSDTYDISARGLDLTTDLQIDVHGDPVTHLMLTFDPSLKLVRARAGKQELTWTVATDPQTNASEARIELPELIAETGTNIQISAIAAVRMGELSRLPRMRCKGMSWQEGSVQLLVRAPLRINRLQAEGARQTASAPIPTPQSGQSVLLQCFSGDSTIDLKVDRPEDRWSADMGTRLEFVGGDVIARSVIDLAILQGEQSSIECDVASQWQIDAVEAREPAVITDWDVQGVDPKRRLSIRFASPVTSADTLRLAVTGRRATVLNETFRLRDLTMLRFPDLLGGRRFVMMQEPEGYDLQLRKLDQMTRVNTSGLPVAHPLYVDPMPRGVAIEQNFAADDLELILTSRKPEFTAKLSMEATVRGTSLVETGRIRCQPSGASMDRLLIHASHDDAEAVWQWSGDKSLGLLTARRLAIDEQMAAGAGSTGQAWEISWRLPRSDSFEIVATKTGRFDTPVPLSLMSTPEAVQQTGDLVVRASDGASVELMNHRLSATSMGTATAESLPTIRGTFQFDPLRDGRGDEPAIVIKPAKAVPEETGAWTWECLLDSRMSGSRATSHLAVFRVQTAGQQHVKISMPAGAALQAAWVDAESLSLSESTRKSGSVSVELPPGRDLVALTLYFTTEQALPDLVGRQSPSFPEINIPVLSRRWRLWVPKGYDVPTSDKSADRATVQSVTWSQRLFGPLGRGATTRNYTPLHPQFWALSNIEKREVESAQRNAAAVIQSLGAAKADDAGTEKLRTWGNVLAATATELKNLDLRLSMASLDEAGIYANSRYTPAEGASATKRGAAILRRLNLVVLVRGNHILLASGPMAAIHHRSLHELDGLPAYFVTDGVLAADMLADPATTQPFDFVTPSGWQLTTENADRRWKLPTLVSRSLTEYRGWNAYQFEVSENTSMQVSVRNISCTSSAALAIALFIAAASFWLGLSRRPWWLVCCALAFAAALLVPQVWIPISSALFLATVASLVFSSRAEVERQDLAPLTRQRGASESKPSPVMAGILILLGVLWVAPISYGQEKPTQPATDPQEGKSRTTSTDSGGNVVFVPIDEEEHEVGDSLYLEEGFYRQLLENALRVREVPNGWLIESARYRVGLNREAVAQGIGSPKVRASYVVQVFDRDSLVRIPVGGEGLQFAPNELTIDGHPVTTARANSNEIAFEIDEIGRYQVECSLTPSLQRFGAMAGFEFDIPAVTNSQIELSGTDASRVEVPHAQGNLESDKERGRIVGKLGGQQKLVVRWPEGVGAEGTAASFELDELQWAKVQPGSMVIDVRLNVRVTEGRVRQLRLLADTRLRLLSPTGAETPLAAARALPGDPQTIDLELRQPIIDQAVIELKFVVAGASGVGSLRMPRLEVAGIRSARRWFAISIDPALEFKEEVGEDVTPLSTPEFAAAWGDPNAKPQSAFRIPRGEIFWTLATRPKAITSTVAETLLLAASATSISIEWQAEINSSGGPHWQWHVRSPIDFVCSEVSVSDADGRGRECHWSRDPSDGSLTILPTEPLSGHHRLIVRGHVASSPTDVRSAPRFSIQGIEPTTRRVFVLRHPQVLAQTRLTGEWQPLTELPTTAGLASMGRLFAGFSTADAAAGLQLEIQPNRIESTALQVVTVLYDGENWTAELDYQLRVNSGVVDSLSFEVPPYWTKLVLIDDESVAGTTLSLQSIPGEANQRLVVRPLRPIADKLRFRIRGSLGASEGDRLRVPDIRPLDLGKVSRFLVLPKQMDLQMIEWQTVGLESEQVPGEMHVDAVFGESHLAFQVVGERFQAFLKLLDSTSSQASVELLETRMNVVWDGSCFGVVTMVIVPGGNSSITFSLPPKFRPVHCRVSDIPTRIKAIDADRWQLPLVISSVPQLLELVLQGTVEEAEQIPDDIRIEGIRVEGLPVMRTLWSISGPPQSGPVDTVKDVNSISPMRYQLERFEVARLIDRLLSQANGDANTKPTPSSLAEKFMGSTVTRMQQIAASQHDTERAIRDGNLKLRDRGSNSDDTDRRYPVHASLACRDMMDRIQELVRPFSILVRGGGNVLHLTIRAISADGWLARFAVSTAIVLASFMALRLQPMPWSALTMPWLGLIVAIVWWFCLSPEFLAIPLFVLSLAAIAWRKTQTV